MLNSIKRWLRSVSLSQLIVLCALLLVFGLILVCPLIALFSKAFMNKNGEWAGLANYQKYFDTPSLSVSIWNTMDISLWSTVFAVVLGFFFAYALTRTRIKGKTFFKYIAMIPIFIPTLVHALALVYLFGNQQIMAACRSRE